MFLANYRHQAYFLHRIAKENFTFGNIIRYSTILLPITMMNSKSLLIFSLMLLSLTSFGQNPENIDSYLQKRTPEPFLFSVTTLTQEDLKWSLDYSASYGERVTGPFGYEGVGQNFAVKGYLGKQFTLYANAALGFSGKDHVTSMQHAEVLHDFIGGKKNIGLRFGIGLGATRDYSNVKSLMSRVALSYDADRWKAGGNLLLEKAFADNRDAIDVITSVGFHYRLAGQFYGGLEAVGEDLEGFWDKEEAEGGAKLLLGPSLNMTSKNSKLFFSLSGGPVFYATQNQVSNTSAIRDLPTQPGMTIRARVVFNLTD